jgi:sporulation protein YlmC with PRC-barrel domain
MAKTEIVTYESELAKLAEMSVNAEKSSAGVSFITTSGGTMKYRDNPISGNSLEVVVLASPVERLYYTSRFDPTNSAPPVCFALGSTLTGLKPSHLSETVQAELCESCPKNQWGSATNGGKGKACSEKRRLFLMTSDSINTVDSVGVSEVAALRIPVTSVKGFATYVQTVASTVKRPLAGVVTKVSLVPDPKTQFKIQFTYVKAIEDIEIIKALITRGEREMANAINEPSTGEEVAVVPTSSKY